MRVEHKIVEREDYSVVMFIGGLWLLIVGSMAYGGWWLVMQVFPETEIMTTIFFTLLFCLGVYKGRDFFKPEKTKEVIHIIK